MFCLFDCLFVWFVSLRPINNLSVIKGRVFLGWTSTKLGLMFLLKNTTQWRRWGSNPRPFGLKSSTLPLSHCAPYLNMCFGCSKEPSHWDGSSEYPQHMFWMRNKENIFPIRTLILRPAIYFKSLIFLQKGFSKPPASFLWTGKNDQTGCMTRLTKSSLHTNLISLVFWCNHLNNKHFIIWDQLHLSWVCPAS